MVASEMKRVHAFVSGKVQGVGFRASTRRKATSLDVTGWVKNLDDGRVEVVAEGGVDGVDALVDFLHDGPRTARVSDVDVTVEPVSGEFDAFTVRY